MQRDQTVIGLTACRQWGDRNKTFCIAPSPIILVCWRSPHCRGRLAAGLRLTEMDVFLCGTGAAIADHEELPYDEPHITNDWGSMQEESYCGDHLPGRCQWRLRPVASAPSGRVSGPGGGGGGQRWQESAGAERRCRSDRRGRSGGRRTHDRLPGSADGAGATDGSKLYVTSGTPGRLGGRSRHGIGQRDGDDPGGAYAPARMVTPDGKRLYVCNQFNNDVSVIDLA